MSKYNDKKTSQDIIEEYIIRNALLTELIDNIEYIREYGDIPLYLEGHEELVEGNIKKVEDMMNQCNSLLEEVCNIIEDNYDF